MNTKVVTERLEAELAAIAHWEPHVHALLHFDEKGARKRAASASEGPLGGWSVAIKDIVDWAGYPTRCGVTFLPDEPAKKNAAFVDALLAKGAFIMSKATTTSFAFRDPSPTCNPWNLEHTPGGSSSGSAAAVAAGMVRLAIGTQTVASINRPASYCGVIGFKPTYGTFDKSGVFPFAPSVDTVGYFTADAKDAQTAFAALTAKKAAPLRSFRVGYVTDIRCQAPSGDMQETLESCAKRLQRAGHDVRPLALPELCAAAYEYHWTLAAAEIAQAHELLLAKYGPAYPPNLRGLIERGQKVSAAQLKEIEKHREQTALAIDQLFDDFDLLLTPAALDPAPKGLGFTGEAHASVVNSYTGIPALTLPAGLSIKRLPLGVQLLARRGDDARLLAAGLAVETLLNFDFKPVFPA